MRGRTHRWRLVAAAVVPLALVLGGCTDDDPGTTPDPTPSPASSAATSGAPEDGVTPATGPVVETRVFRVSVPEGYRVGETSFNLTPVRGEGIDSIAVVAARESAPATLGELARLAQRYSSASGTPRRVADTEIAGRPAYHLVARGEFTTSEELGLWTDGHRISITFETEGSQQERDALIASVLASWEWR